MADFQPIDGKIYPRFSGLKTFFRLPYIQEPDAISKLDVALLGVPFDGGVSYRPGARFGPEHVRSISSLGRGYHPAHDCHIFKSRRVADVGDVQIVPQDIQKTQDNIRLHVARLLKEDVLPFMVGGDHSTTIGSLQAMVDRHGPINIVHFDAHTDTYPAAWGCDTHHGTFMRLGHERGWFREKGVYQVGIRGPFSSENDLEVPRKMGYTVVTADEVHLAGIEYAFEEFQKIDPGPTYISFDVDGMDPAFAPGTGTPVPGGLSSFQAMQILRMLKGTQIIGGDVVEISPPYDHADMTSLAAVSILWEMMALISSGS